MPYLTKSRFKIALECPTRLYYNDNKQYANTATEDTFLMELAKGGFQVGALSRCYYFNGVSIDTLDPVKAFSETLKLLQQENVVIFEAGLLFQNYFIRADILIKKGRSIELMEVKAKSFAPSEDSFFNKKEGIEKGWQSYLYDITFQTWVVNKCFQSNELGHLKVMPYLMLVNKEVGASVEGLNQRFYVDAVTRKIEQDKELTNTDQLGTEILIKINVEREVEYLLEQTIDNLSFTDFIEQAAHAVVNKQLLTSSIGIKCKSCGFVADEEALNADKLSGFQECWKREAQFTDEDFKKPMSWTIWDSRRKNLWFEEKKYFTSQLSVEDFGEDKSKSFGISRIERQEIQRIKTINNDYSPYVDKNILKQYFSQWDYPLHCIDFETTAVALTFHKGMHPYEQIAFQFSHHIISEDGTVAHQNEWINTIPGKFPNFDFVRALKLALGEEGTIFRYSAHENTILCCIHAQLKNSTEEDKEELMGFIETITCKKDKNKILWEGERNMVDLLKVVKEAYYSLYAGGSNSIKYILPAVLNSSKDLQEKYTQPIYGTDKITSKNFKNHSWIKKEKGLVINPYKLLEPVFSREEDLALDNLLMDEESGIYDGGAAMAAYGKMQFTQMTDEERQRISQALLRYCELDTLAMVMILEEFKRLSI